MASSDFGMVDSVKDVSVFFESIFEHYAIGIVIIDGNGNILKANRAFHKNLGYVPEKLNGTPLKDVAYQGDVDSLLKNYSAVHSGKLDSHSSNQRFVSANGEIVWVHNSLNATKINGHSTKFVVLMSRDITSQIKREAELAVSAALDNLPLSVMLVDPKGTVQASNRTAQQILDQKDGVFITPEKKLLLGDKDDQYRFLELINYASRTGTFAHPPYGEAMTIQRRSMKKNFSILVAPVRGGGSFDQGERRPGALVYFTDPEKVHITPTEILCSLYGLTQAEARIAAEIVDGKSMTEIAEDNGVSQNTVKSQLKRIFAKTETQGQSDLIRLILRSPAMMET